MHLSPSFRRRRPSLRLGLRFLSGKLDGRSLLAAHNLSQPLSRHFRIRDHITGMQFLVDTGAEVSIIPPSSSDCRQRVKTASLTAVNATAIWTFGQRSLTPPLGLRRSFPVLFWVAEVRRAIISSNFLQIFRRRWVCHDSVSSYLNLPPHVLQARAY